MLLLKNAPGAVVVVALAFSISVRFVAATFSLSFQLSAAALVAASGFSFQLFKRGCSRRLLLLKKVPGIRTALVKECIRGCGCSCLLLFREGPRLQFFSFSFKLLVVA